MKKLGIRVQWEREDLSIRMPWEREDPDFKNLGIEELYIESEKGFDFLVQWLCYNYIP